METNGPEPGRQKLDERLARSWWKLASWKDALTTRNFGTLASWKDALEATQSFATIVALIIGGYWTYMIFIMERSSFPHAKLSQSVQGRLITQEWYWIRVSITIENTGKYLISTDTIDIRVQQISPLPDNIWRDINEKKDPVPTNGLVLPWLRICHYLRPFKRKIEPGETETKDVEFVIPAWLKTIRVYTYLKNTTSSENIGWDTITIFDMKGNTDEQTSIGTLRPSNLGICAIDS